MIKCRKTEKNYRSILKVCDIIDRDKNYKTYTYNFLAQIYMYIC